ncbi:MAG: ATP-binding cassette domain-containing protein [Gemmatimonadota bacterium]|nr:ATP-binding cassette domain-containing protein [Gemmatimonadota bacterium]
MPPEERDELRETPRELSAHDLVLRYGNVVALAGASIKIAARQTLAIVGESGSGKTTLLRCFNRMVEPDSGRVEVGGVDVRSGPVIALRRRIGYVPQDGGLLPHWRVLRNVALVPSLLRIREPDVAAAEALRVVGMPVTRFGQRFPHELSGGQRQRVALARALAARPGVILLDEPFGALDAITRSELHEAFENARREFPVTMLLVTHDLAEAARLADEVAVMRAGRVEQRGSMAELHASPATGYVAALLKRGFASGGQPGPA